jgi:GST-like protein
LRRVNPLAQVPTLLTPAGAVLTESAAILIHLGEAFPDSGLLPRDILRRAQVIRGLVFIAANCYAAIGIIDYPERWCQDVDDDLKTRIRAATTARLHGFWDLFADSFPATPFLNGKAPGALDLLAAVVSKWSGARDHLRSSRPGFHQLLLRIDAAPPAAPVLARQLPE